MLQNANFSYQFILKICIAQLQYMYMVLGVYCDNLAGNLIVPWWYCTVLLMTFAAFPGSPTNKVLPHPIRSLVSVEWAQGGYFENFVEINFQLLFVVLGVSFDLLLCWLCHSRRQSLEIVYGYSFYLTLCGLCGVVTPYGNKDLGQHCLR